MLDAGCRVCRPTPGGTYEPVRSLAATHREVDDTMHDRDRAAKHGLARGTGALGGALGRGREIAQEYLAMMGIRAPEAEAPGAVASPEPMDPGGWPRRLREGIAREARPAGPAMPGHCPGTGGPAPPGAGEAS